jgi:hypothetical protein
MYGLAMQRLLRYRHDKYMLGSEAKGISCDFAVTYPGFDGAAGRTCQPTSELYEMG